MTQIIHVTVLSVGSFVTIFILAKLMGYRQMSQLSMFDYINGITIGSIAAEMATSLEDDFRQPLIAMIVYALLALMLSLLTSKSVVIRRFVEGKPLLLVNNGEVYRDNLRKAKIDVTELLVQCRVNGYFDLSKIETAVLEGNGKISFLPKVSDRPLTPADVNLDPQQEHMVANVVLDGRIMEENLKHTGRDEKWLHSQIKGQGAKKIEDVLLATCDSLGQVKVFLKNSRKNPQDIFC